LDSSRAHTQRYDIYQAPETHTGQNRNRTADIFSLASIFYEVLTGHPPFATTQDRNQCDPLRLSQPSLLTERQWQHLQMALSAEPKARPANAIALIKGMFQPDEAETNNALADNHDGEPGTDHSGEEAHEPPRLSEADLAPDASPLKNSPPTTPERDTSTGSKRRILPFITFCVGLLIGYLASLLLTTSSPPADISAPAGLPTAVAPEVPSPMVADTESSPEEDNVQATVSKSEITSEPSSLTDTQTAVSLAAQLTESQAPRTLLFRDQITDDVYGPDMVALPSGQFQMGDNHAMGDDNEQPLHAVTIEHPFALSRYEVTFSQYDMFARATQRKLPSDEDWGRANRPVINISWLDAQAYTAWLATQTGQPYRLPTEAEWEYAARAGTQTAFSWGNEPQSGFAVCDECSSDWGGSQTAPVGSQHPNAWGLYDMSGNVSEWVEDCYAPNYKGAPDNGAARQADGCHYRAMRGGSWFDIMRLMRPAGRYRHPASASQNDWGFRVALDLPEQFIKENN
ncbi:MAG: SUMF1/EgtB/PvdO family nonheme iron enzyme, partial [Oceanospirillaceae bacterium]|nr:SUMF1/EgtB/PvdO family nonheme iron enzyme [Oceanospirillaceae bacterium]